MRNQVIELLLLLGAFVAVAPRLDRAAVNALMSALGQKQTFAVHKPHVRFTPESGHQLRHMECPLRAKS